MQRARRRLTCSTASASSPSNSTLKARRRSRTSSTGVDSFTCVKDSKKSERACKVKVKPRGMKHKNQRLLVSKLKATKRMMDVNKSEKPTYEHLRNTVVLAPFHTIKKCFQNELVDLYRREKMKQLDNKIKMSKRRNTTFEYDVIELKPTKPKNIKKKVKPSKILQKEVQKEKIEKRKRSRSPSFCQCNKSASKLEVKKYGPKAGKQKTTASLGREILNCESQNPSFFLEMSKPSTKKRRLSNQIVTPNVLQNELAVRPILQTNKNFNSARRSNMSVSAVSSHSKVDSWETSNGSPSSREEHLKGSLAISTTSFDSYLEQFEKNSCDFSENISVKTRRSSRNPQSKGKEKPKKKNSGKIFVAENILSKPKGNRSRHMIMNAGAKSSDGRITDFLDREPQTMVISNLETTQHLQPLRRRSKARAKQSNSRETSKSNNLRSDYQNKEQNLILDVQERRKSREKHDRGSTHCFRYEQNCHDSGCGITLNTDLGISINDNRRSENAASQEEILGKKVKIDNKSDKQASDSHPTTPNEEISLETPCQEIDIASDSFSNSESTKNKKEKLLNIEKSRKQLGTNSKTSSEPPCDKILKRITRNTVEGQPGEDNLMPDILEQNREGDGKDFCNGEVIEPCLDDNFSINDGSVTKTSMDFFQNLESHLDRDSDAGKAEDKEKFIFGARSASDGMGESCKFSFGLNWTISDDDDSDHADYFC